MNNVELGEILRKRGIRSGSDLVEAVEGTAVIYFFVKKGAVPYAELHYWNGDEEHVSTHWAPASLPLPASRKRAVADAKREALYRWGIGSGWCRTPFSNCWMLVEDMDYVRDEFLGIPETA